jgi:hypothetical protein
MEPSEVRNNTDYLEDDPTFTCEYCGSHECNGSYVYDVITYYTETLKCRCGESIDGVAALRTYHVVTTYEASGPLDENGLLAWEDHEELDELEEEDLYEVYCADCLEESDEYDWEITEDDVEIENESDDLDTKCARCGSEI